VILVLISLASPASTTAAGVKPSAFMRAKFEARGAHGFELVHGDPLIERSAEAHYSNVIL
jgi:hypothetical protein